jgi:hypothetical protein
MTGHNISTTYGQPTRVDASRPIYQRPADRSRRALLSSIVAVVVPVVIVVAAMGFQALRELWIDDQAKLFDATLHPDQITRSGITRKAEIAATSEEQARVIARAEFHWPEGKFSVTPKVNNYLTVRFVEVTP